MPYASILAAHCREELAFSRQRYKSGEYDGPFAAAIEDVVAGENGT